MYRPHIVILGAGYGGLMTAIKLQKLLHVNKAKITLVNNNDYHYQTTWLHENAAGTLKPEKTAIPIRDVINQDKVEFILDEVVMIHEKEKKVKLKSRELSFDILVVSLGFEAETLNTEEMGEHIFPIENLNNARLIREHLEYNFAMYANEEVKNDARLNIVIVGGGFTGIEFAGELVNRIPELSKEYDIDKTQIRIINIESGSSILSGVDDSLVNYAMNSLKSRGVEFITGATYLESTEDVVIYEKDGEKIKIPAMTKVWAGGVRANSIIEASGIETVNSKVKVRSDLRLPNNDHVYVIGDCAHVPSPDTGEAYPATARIAVKEGETAAHNIHAQLNGEPLIEFRAKQPGTIASLGQNDGIALTFTGKKLYGWRAAFIKNMSENRYLLQLGGMDLLMKKGRLYLFNN